MKINVIGTGSSGNAYLVKDNKGNCILLDCGLPFKQITNNSNFPKFNKLDLVFTSHLH